MRVRVGSLQLWGGTLEPILNARASRTVLMEMKREGATSPLPPLPPRTRDRLYLYGVRCIANQFRLPLASPFFFVGRVRLSCSAWLGPAKLHKSPSPVVCNRFVSRRAHPRAIVAHFAGRRPFASRRR